jgi:signal transduction histidine kinase
MKFWKHRPPKMLLLVAVMLALLALLATLQYRWLGQVSAGERERMQASVSAGAARFSQDFNREITRAYLSFQVEAETLREKGDAEYAARFEQWDSKAPYPKLISDVFIFERDEHEALRLRRFNRELKKFEPVEWPANFARLRTRLEQGLLPSKNPEVEREISLDPVEADLPALVAPIIRAPKVIMPDEHGVQIFKGEEGLPGMSDLSPLTGYIIVKLDQDVIRNEMLPALARQYFSGGDGLDYNLTVINPQEPDKPVYQTVQTAQAQPKGDATAHLMDVQLDQLDTLFFGLPRRPLPDKERATFFTQKLPPGEVIMRSNEQTHSSNTNGRSVTVRVFNREMQGSATRERTAAVGAGSWQLLIQHRAGSLEAAVTNARRRSLAVSFGILLLLAGSVTMIVISTRRAERLAHRQMEFVSAVSHEFRTPLAVICSAGENLADGIVDAPQQVAKYGELVRNEGRRLTEMVEQVLEYAGARSGRAYQLRPVAVESIIEDSLASYQPLLKEQGYVVDKRIAEDLPPVLADAAALRRSLQNLLSNAMKYDGGKRWIGIRAQSAVKEQGEEVQLTVEDQGIGIAPDEAANVFEPFYRGREVVEAQIHGNGLGLSLVRQVIEAHHGKVTLVSAPGQGSAFTLHLPALNQAENEDGASII